MLNSISYTPQTLRAPQQFNKSQNKQITFNGIEDQSGTENELAANGISVNTKKTESEQVQGNNSQEKQASFSHICDIEYHSGTEDELTARGISVNK